MKRTISLLLCLSLFHLSNSLSIGNAFRADDEHMEKERAEFFARHNLQYWEQAIHDGDYARLSSLTNSVKNPLSEAQEHTDSLFKTMERNINLIHSLTAEKRLPFMRMRILQLVTRFMGKDYVSFYRLESVRKWFEMRDNVTHIPEKEWRLALESVTATQRDLTQILETIEGQTAVIREEAGKLIGFNETRVRQSSERMTIVFSSLKKEVTDGMEEVLGYVYRLSYLFRQKAEHEPVISSTTTESPTEPALIY